MAVKAKRGPAEQFDPHRRARQNFAEALHEVRETI
jgi:hypothetical protein